MYVTAVIPAAGRGVRLKSKISKPLIDIAHKPLLIRTLSAINNCPSIKEIIVVVNSADRNKIIGEIKKFKIGKVRRVILGGSRRQDSVRKGLEAVLGHTDLVLIHDAARPFVSSKIIERAIKAARESGAAIVAVPVKSTVKKVVVRRASCAVRKLIVKETVDRRDLWEIQTPQVFKRDLIVKAFDKFGNIEVTDDSMLVEKLGAKVSIVLGSYNNIKITTPEDLILAQALLKI